MKKLENPTTFFFKQAQNITDPYSAEIQAFSKALLDRNSCPLCKNSYDITTRIPRIMIHCGHTFCTPCLFKFYMNRRVRCPMCLKLVKQIDSIERIPINHTIFKDLVQNLSKNKQKQCPIKDASKYLFGEFQRVQKEAHKLQNPQKIDPDSGLPFCVFHPDRVEHFFCQSHNIAGCRVCIQVGHSKSDCTVADLYTVQNPQKYLSKMVDSKLIKADISDPFIVNSANMYKNGNFMFGLNDNDELQDEFLDDSSQDHKSI